MSHGTLLVDWTISKENFKRFAICPTFSLFHLPTVCYISFIMIKFMISLSLPADCPIPSGAS